MADRKNILSGDEDQLTEEDLLKYLHHNLSKEERDQIEKKILADPFESDAVEGLLEVQNKESLQKHMGQLHLKLRQLTGKKPRKEKEKIKVFEWMILAILVLLFLCVMSFIIINLNSTNNFNTILSYPVRGITLR